MVWNIRRSTIITSMILLMLVNQALAEDLFAENLHYATPVLPAKPPANTNIKNNSVIEQGMVKEELPLSQEDQAVMDYNKEVELLKKSQEVEAVIFFKKALNVLPKYHKARMQLIQIYQKIGWLDEMEKLLQAGLNLDPENVDFIKNLAILYNQKTQPRKALSILLTMPDLNYQQSDYLALLALTYLNINQPDMAEKYYQQLLTFNKENPIWWVGLAIAQDAAGKHKDSAESFHKAKNLGRFNAEILDYINNQLEQIKQR